MLYVLDRAQAALCVLSNYYDDTHEIDIEAGVSSYQFTITKKESGAEFLQTGNYIVMQDDLGVNMVFTILKTTEVHETIQVYAIDAGIELFNKMMAEWTETEAHPIAYYIEKCLKNTPWKIGVNEISSLSRKISYEGKDTGLSRILSLLNSFDKAEINFSLKLKGLTITDWNINIYKQLGSNRTDVQVVYSRELNDITKEESREVFVTALQGIGASIEVEEGKPEKHTDFTNEDYDDGDFVSPIGDSWLYARTANEQFNPTKAYIEDYFEYDTSSPSELLNRTITQIKERSIPSITYNADISIIDPTLKIGDYITIIDHDYRPALYLRGRVLKMTKSYTDLSKNKVTMGNYQVLQSNIDDRLKDLQEQIKSIPAGKTLYTWVRYASDDKGTNMTSTPTANTKYVAIVSNKPTGVPSDKSADYAGHWQLIQGQDGKDGIPGAKGADGKTSYTHFAYANDVSGYSDFSLDDPTDRSYMGVYSDFTKPDSTNPDDYVWSLTKGETGEQGIQGLQGPQGTKGIAGPKGADGKTQYTHIAYSNSADGKTDFSQTPANHKYIGMYVDFIEDDSKDPTKYGWSLIKGEDGLDGAQGIAGKPGADGKTSYTHIAYADTAIGGGFSQSPDNKKYVGMYVDFTENDSSDPNKYNWSLIKGDDGAPGKDGVAGKDGVGIKSTQIMYAQNTSGTTAPTTGWTAQVPTLIKGQYLWTQTTWLYTDSTGEAGYTVSYNAKDGNTGANGIAGKDGVGIKSTVIEYAVSSNGITKPNTGWSTTIPTVTPGQFLWTRTTWLYTDSTNEVGYSVAQAGATGPKGDKGNSGTDGVAGKDGIGIKSTAITYALGDSGTVAPTTGWTTSVPSLVKGKYLWTKTVWLYTDNTSESGYSTTYIGKDGNNGNNGVAGKDGVGIKSTTITYQSGTSGTVQPTGAWVSNPPSVAGGNYLWTRTIWSYTDKTSETGYSVAKMGEKGPQGLQGLQGATGNQGIQGPKGPDGKSSYTHIAYGTSNSGAGFTQTPSTSTTYIGMYVDQTATDNNDPKKYAWSLIKGADGAQGTPGAKGADGKTPYFHSAWANSADGKTGFNTTDSVNKSYLGTYTDFTVEDSANPTKYAWSLIKGRDGLDGKNGIPGKPGADGKTPYFHTAWATSADGKNGFSITDSANKTYLGTYTDFTKPDSTDTTKYAWSLIKGRDGTNGTPGKPGVDGKTPYFHTAWADSKDGKINFNLSDATNRGYLGTYTDFKQADSKDPAKYSWVELVGALEVGGINLIIRHDELKNKMIDPSGEVGNYNDSSVTKVVVSVKPGNALTMTRYNGAADNYFRFAFYDASGAVVKRAAIDDLSHTEEVPHEAATFRISYGTGLIVKLERGRKSSEYTPAPEDTQEQIDSVDRALVQANNKINEVPHVSAQAGAPTNPKKGDQWWVLDASSKATGFKVWSGTAWNDSKIQQSLLNVVSLNAVTITGSTINGSKFQTNYSNVVKNITRAYKVTVDGVIEIANGAFLNTYKYTDKNNPISFGAKNGEMKITSDTISSKSYNSSGVVVASWQLDPATGFSATTGTQSSIIGGASVIFNDTTVGSTMLNHSGLKLFDKAGSNIFLNKVTNGFQIASLKAGGGYNDAILDLKGNATGVNFHVGARDDIAHDAQITVEGRYGSSPKENRAKMHLWGNVIAGHVYDAFEVRDASDELGAYKPIRASAFQVSSNPKYKENIVEFNDGLNVIRDVDVYNYSLSNELSEDKYSNHIGMMLDNTPKEFISDSEGVDIYSIVSVLVKATQQLDKENKLLTDRIDSLEERLSKLENVL